MKTLKKTVKRIAKKIFTGENATYVLMFIVLLIVFLCK